MTRTFAASAFALCLAFPSFATAQTSGDAKPDAAKAEAPAKDSRSDQYDGFIKDLKKVDGSMPIFVKKRDIFMEVPESRLGQIFLIQAALHSGIDGAFLSAGMPIGGNTVDAFKWVRNEETLMLVRPNIQYRYEKGDAYALGAARTFPEATLGTFPIVQQDPARKRLLINVTSLLYGDVFRLPEMVMNGLGGPYQIERDKSGFLSGRGDDEHTVVRMKLQFFSPRGSSPNPMMELLGMQDGNTLEDDRSAPLEVTYTMGYRTDDGYVPRTSDPRIGYFTESFFSTARYLEEDRTQRFINRWSLKKRDPKAALSEPVKPIVWTIDPSIPVDLRPAIKEGVLRWNKAFTGLGYKDAIQVVDAPTGDAYDHADAGRNVIRLLVGPGAPFAAISLFRTDPFSGQILNASITLDGNIIRDMQEEHARNVASMASAQTRALSVLKRDAARKDSDDFLLFATPQERMQRAVAERLTRYGWAHSACEFGSELKRESDLMWYALASAPAGRKVNRDEYVKRFLADCVCHEMGHCLGLRHNFAGSTELTTAQLGDDKLTDRVGVSASVMDYNPPNVMAVLRGSGNFYAPTIGAYDEWAIQYGYKDFGAATPGAERASLASIARLSGLPGHAYIPDEEADRTNPYGVRFDGAKDPLNYSSHVLLSMRRATDYAAKHLPLPGESYSKRTGVILNALLRSVREGRNAARFVGGVVTTKNFRGDAGERPTIVPVDPKLQRQAVAMITANFFAPEALRLSPEILKNLSFEENEPAWTAPVRDIVGGQQQSLLALLLSASTTDRIAENAIKQPSGYELEEHYRTLFGAIFAENKSGTSIPPLRRDLQRFALSALMAQAGAPQGAINEDVRTIASQNLRGIDAQLKARLANPVKLDAMTRLHLKDEHESVARFLSRSTVSGR